MGDSQNHRLWSVDTAAIHHLFHGSFLSPLARVLPHALTIASYVDTGDVTHHPRRRLPVASDWPDDWHDGFAVHYAANITAAGAFYRQSRSRAACGQAVASTNCRIRRMTAYGIN